MYWRERCWILRLSYILCQEKGAILLKGEWLSGTLWARDGGVCVHLPENKGVVVVVFGNGLIDMHSLYPTYAVVAQRVMESS